MEYDLPVHPATLTGRTLSRIPIGAPPGRLAASFSGDRALDTVQHEGTPHVPSGAPRHSTGGRPQLCALRLSYPECARRQAESAPTTAESED